MLTEKDFISAPEKLFECSVWASEISLECTIKSKNKNKKKLNIEGLTYHISTKDNILIPDYLPYIRKIGEVARLELYYDSEREEIGNGTHVTVANR